MNPSQILFGQHRPIIVWRRGVRARPRRTKEPSLRRACVFLVVVEYRRVIKNHQPINFVVGPVGASMGQKQIEGSLSWRLILDWFLHSNRLLAQLSQLSKTLPRSARPSSWPLALTTRSHFSYLICILHIFFSNPRDDDEGV